MQVYRVPVVDFRLLPTTAPLTTRKTALIPKCLLAKAHAISRSFSESYQRKTSPVTVKCNCLNTRANPHRSGAGKSEATRLPNPRTLKEDELESFLANV